MTTEVYARVSDAGEELVGAVPARTLLECESPEGESQHVAFETLRASILGGDDATRAATLEDVVSLQLDQVLAATVATTAQAASLLRPEPLR